jgi:asparagine synthase (glutamine-hydrolysing)
MSNPRGTIWLTYNGEIYNADELRTELVGLGFGFRSRGDTEVILRGYEAWGREVVGRLRGMFALAVYDARQHATPTLLLARDPLGIKPLYYTLRDGVLAFASECRALLATPLAGRTIDAASLLAYLQLGSVPAPLTIFAGIRALEAGSSLEARHDGLGWRLERVTAAWRPPPSIDSAPRQAYQYVVKEIRELLLDSVRRHLVSDVPIGAFLSGGLDSGTIVALMREANPAGVIRTCSVIFQEPEHSEAAYAREVARRFETEHVEVPVSADDLGGELENVIAALDQPTNDGINTYMVSQAARNASLTVALSGLGGDELFGGYPSFRRIGHVMRGSRWAGVMPGGREVLARALETRGEHHPAARLGGWMRAGKGNGAAAYLGLRGLFSDREVRNLVLPEAAEAGREGLDLVGLVQRSAGLASDADSWGAASRYELTCYMRHQLLRDTDVMSMAHSLEVRVPFVDQQVVERVLALDVQTLRGGQPKQILREIARTLPDSVRLRRDKQGFSFPFQTWLSGPLRPKLEELMRSAEAQFAGYLRPGASEYLLGAFDAGRLHWSRPWAVAALGAAFATSDCQTSAEVSRGHATSAAPGAEIR